MEAYAYAIRHHVEVMEELGHAPRRFLVSDGGSASAVWMQIVADVLGQPLRALAGHPGTCLGAAWTAAMGAGLGLEWSGVDRFVTPGPEYRPDPATRATYDAGYARFRALYRQIYPR